MHLSAQKTRLNAILSVILSVLIFLIFVLFIWKVQHTNRNTFYILVAIGALAAYSCYGIFTKKFADRKKLEKIPFPEKWRAILEQDVHYYRQLSKERKALFETELQIFLHETRVTGIKCEVDDRTLVLAACAAEIPVFSFPEWEYDNLGEILIYPNAFTKDFRLEGEGRNVWGMVGTGFMEGLMILAKPALISGFQNPHDKMNVGIHEFAHLLDAADGHYDGVPKAFLEHKYLGAWSEVMKYEINRIKKGKSKMNAYGGTSDVEFFAVATEYFFENPAAMEQEKPELYALMKQIFRQDTASKFKVALKSLVNYTGKKLGRNDSCPCQSGKKYKDCCLSNSRTYASEM